MTALKCSVINVYDAEDEASTSLHEVLTEPPDMAISCVVFNDGSYYGPEGARNFSLHYRVQTGSGAHPASYPMGTRGSIPADKEGEA
jgi:hypothetical protein